MDTNEKRPQQMKKIIHIDMDAFYASVEQRDNPAYRGKPIVVGAPPDRRGVVAAASYEARQFGIRSAMASFQAAQRCPDVIFVPPRFEVYTHVSQQIRAIFAEYTNLIEPLSLDEAYLDVTENKKGLSSATLIAREIKARIFEETGLTASAGVSYNKFLAKVASDMDKPNGLYLILPEKAESFLERLPIEKFYGIGKVTAAKMMSLGIHTGGDLKKFSEEELFQMFGKLGLFYYRIVRGQDDREVENEWIRKSIGAENTFDTDLLAMEDLVRELAPLAREVHDWMQRHNTYGRTVTLKVKYDNFRQITRSKTGWDVVDDYDDLMDTLKALLLKTEAGKRKVRLVGVSVSNFGQKIALPEQPNVRQLRLEFKWG